MSVYCVGTRRLSSVYDTNGKALHTAYDLNGRIVFPSTQLVAMTQYDISNGWKFNLVTTQTGYVNTTDYTGISYADSSWTVVDIPYDWSVRQDFNASSSACGKGAYLDGGFGVFRRHLVISSLERRMVLFLDGVFMDSEVYVNGQKVVENHWWNPFSADITEYLVLGENVITVYVKVDQPNSRWYSGAGILRKIYLIECEPEGTTGVQLFKVTTPNIKGETGGSVTTRVYLTLTKPDSVTLKIKDSSGNILATSHASGMEIQKDLLIQNPSLWSCDAPVLYYAEATIGQRTTVETRFGYRWFEFDNDGMKMNGKSLKIKGFCIHEDTNCLGMEANKSAYMWKLGKLKEIGCNAVRTCHNPFSKEFVDTCDELGMLICYEMFDCWNIAKEGNYYDFARNFNSDWSRVIDNSIKRDLNSPAVFMWVVGNEIQFDEMDNSYITSQISAIRTRVHELDASRPITIGDSTLKAEKISCIVPYIDVIGCNYADSSEYEMVRSSYPNMPIIGTEAYSALHTRGIYENNDESCFCTELDERKVGWGNYFWEVCDMWYDDNQSNIGAFSWTGFDYLGEPTPFANSSCFPARSSQFGVFDNAGFRKDASYMFESIWNDSPMVHIGRRDWDSPTTGQSCTVRVYTNQQSVELFLNGMSLGKNSSKSSMHSFDYVVEYVRGTLSCVAYDSNGEIAASDTVNTSEGTTAKISLTAKTSSIDSSDDYAFVECQLLDLNGVFVPRACENISFSVDGGSVYGTENGYPKDGTNMKNYTRDAFNGKILCVAKPDGNTGIMNVTAKLKDSPSISASIKITKIG